MRWTGDERGHGIASGEAFLPALDHLRRAMTQGTWVAEQPEVHLLPHIRRAVERDASPWRLVNTTVRDAVLEVTLEWLHGGGNPAELRADVMALIGSFTESNTFVHQASRDTETVFEVTTGMLAGDGGFTGHGHLVCLIVQRNS